MNIKITPSSLSGTIHAISSKSHAHRAIIAAALADRPTQINLNCISEDIDATARCIEELGGRAERNQNGLLISPIHISAGYIPALDFGESGTTARLLIPIAAALFDRARFTGSGRLPQRPFSPLFDTMNKNGFSVSSSTLPATQEHGIESGIFELDGNISSQFVSGLLFALPLLSGDSQIILKTPLESLGYVNMTLDTLRQFGVTVTKTENGYLVKGGGRYRSPGEITIEGDWSNAAFWAVSGAIGVSPVIIKGLSFRSLQGDRIIEKLIIEFGLMVRREQKSTLEIHWGRTRGITIDAKQIPDLVPALAVLGALAEGETRITNAARLRLKESDRLKAITAMLSALGADITEGEDSLTIIGKARLNGGTIDSAGDHRIAMAAAICAQRCKYPVTILGADAVNKSYPSFWEHFKQLGGKIDVV